MPRKPSTCPSTEYNQYLSQDAIILVTMSQGGLICCATYIDEVVEEEEEDGGVESGLVVRERAEAGEARLTDCHADCGREHEFAAAEAVDGEGADDGADDDDDLGGGGEDTSYCCGEAKVCKVSGQSDRKRSDMTLSRGTHSLHRWCWHRT